MGKMLQRYVNDAYRDQPLASLREKLFLIAPTASTSQRLQVGMLPLLLPDLVRTLEQIIVNAKDDQAARGFAGGLLAYVYNPLDIIPDEEGPIGLVDDTVVCALGLGKLVQREQFVHDEFTQGACELVVGLLGILDGDLRDALERFVEDLSETTARQVSMGVFGPSSPSNAR